MKIEVLTTQWAHDGGVLAGGVHEIDKPSKQLLGAAASAESVGSIKVTASADERAKMKAAIQPDSESLRALEKAQANSTWHVGNVQDYIAVKGAVLADPEADLDDETRASLEQGVAQSKEILKGLEKGLSYEDAVTEVLNG